MIEGIPLVRYKTNAATLAFTDKPFVFKGNVVTNPHVMRRILDEWSRLPAWSLPDSDDRN